MKLINRKFTTIVAMLLFIVSIAVPGVSAAPEDMGKNRPSDMNAEEMKERNSEMIGNSTEMKERNIEMIENSIDLLNELRSETDDEYLIESIDDLLEKLESLDSELDSAEDSEDIKEIMDNVKALIDNSPDEIREAFMQGSSRNLENKEDNPRETGNDDIPRKSNNVGNNSTISEITGMEKAVQEKNDNENTGLFSGIIGKIMSLF